MEERYSARDHKFTIVKVHPYFILFSARIPIIQPGKGPSLFLARKFKLQFNFLSIRTLCVSTNSIEFRQDLLHNKIFRQKTPLKRSLRYLRYSSALKKLPVYKQLFVFAHHVLL